MMPKVLLLVCVLPLVLGGGWSMDGGDGSNMMEMFKKFKQMNEEKQERKHYPGDGDCPTEEEKQMMEYRKHMEEVKKYKEYKESEAEKAMEQKKELFMMWQQHQEMKMKEEKQEQFKEMMEKFVQQKHAYAFKLTHSFLQLCKCGEVSEQMNKMFMMDMDGAPDYTANMATADALAALESGDMASLAQKLKQMPKDVQKKVFMAGLIKSMCGGAKTFVLHAKMFQENYLSAYMRNTTMPTTTP